MDEPTSPGSPSRSESSMRKNSSNPLSKLLFRRKGSNSSLSPGSTTRREDNGEDASGAEVVDGEHKEHSFVEEVKDIAENLETSVHGLFHHHHHKKEAEPMDTPTSMDSRDSSFSGSGEGREHRHHRFLNKVKHGYGKAKEGLKEAKQELKSIIRKETSDESSRYDHSPYKYSESNSSSSDDDNDEVKTPTLAEKLKEDDIAHNVHEEIGNAPIFAQQVHEEVVHKAPIVPEKVHEEIADAPIVAQHVHEEVAHKAPIVAEKVQEEVSKVPIVAQKIQEEIGKAPIVAQKVQEELGKTPSFSQKLQEKIVKAPNIAQRIQEEVVAVVSTIDEAKKNKAATAAAGTPGGPSEEIKKEEKKEDNCITSLAQGLQNLCSWGSKKEDSKKED